MKKLITVFCVLVLCLTGCSFNNSKDNKEKSEITEMTEDKEAEQISPENYQKEDNEEKEYVQAYKNTIKEYKEEIQEEGIISEKDIVYNVIYLNNDDIPELVIGLNGFRVSIFTYDDGKVYTVMDKWGYGAGGNSGYFYVKGHNVIRNYDAESAGAIVYFSFFKMNEVYELEPYYEEPLYTVYYEDGIMQDPPKYYYGFDEITKEKFDEYCIQGEYMNVAGEMSEEEAIAALEQ